MSLLMENTEIHQKFWLRGRVLITFGQVGIIKKHVMLQLTSNLSQFLIDSHSSLTPNYSFL